MKLEKINRLSDEEFRRLTGVKKQPLKKCWSYRGKKQGAPKRWQARWSKH